MTISQKKKRIQWLEKEIEAYQEELDSLEHEVLAESSKVKVGDTIRVVYAASFYRKKEIVKRFKIVKLVGERYGIGRKGFPTVRATPILKNGTLGREVEVWQDYELEKEGIEEKK